MNNAQQQLEEVKTAIEGLFKRDNNYNVVYKLHLLKHMVFVNPKELGPDQFLGMGYVIQDILDDTEEITEILEKIGTLLTHSEERVVIP